jgi:protein-S-isoprenylcysteine O-methyltransferase Ste14
MKKLALLIFKYRSYTPLPFIFLMFVYQQANIWSLITGFIIAVLGEFIRLWGVSWAGSETRTTGKVGGSFLIISGPFAYVRNPLYVGNILIYFGLGLMSFAIFPYLQIFAIAFFVFQYFYIVIEEENYLKKTFTEEYLDYLKHVPRFFPKFSPYKNIKIDQPEFNWSKGFKSDKRTLQALSFVAITIFALWLIQKFPFPWF